MKRKVKKDKSLCTKLFTMLLACSLIFAGIPSAVIAEVPENLIGTLTVFDPTFETGASEDVTKGGAVLDEAGGHGGNGTHNANGKSLKLPDADNKIFFMASVEPSTNYTFSFWMKNSVVDSLQMPKTGNYFMVMYYNGAKVDRMVGKDKNDILKNANIDWNHTNFAYFVNDTTFGSAHTESEDINKWRQVSINFTTPYEAVDQVHITLACAADDPELAVDDLSLVATGKAPNRIFNGDVEVLRYDKETASASSFTLYKDIELAQLEDGTYCFKTTENSGGTAITSLPMFFFKGKKLGTHYKISMKYKAINDTYANNKAYFRLKTDASDVDTDKKYNFPLLASSGWNTYTMYVDATKVEAAGTSLGARYVWFNGVGQAYMDDFYSGRDESNIGFYKELVLVEDSDSDPYFDLYTGKSGVNVEAEDVLMFERSIEAKSISDITPDDTTGNRTVKTRLHYLPKATWGTDESGNTTVSFTETEVTLLTAVYKYDKNNRKTLYTVDVASGKATDKTIDVVGEVSVPTAGDGERYEVEAMAWDMKDLRTILNQDKAVLQETL